MPSHSHTGKTSTGTTDFIRAVAGTGTSVTYNHTCGYSSNPYTDCNGGNFPGAYHWHGIPSDGGGAAHSILNPYYTVYIFRRTA